MHGAIARAQGADYDDGDEALALVPLKGVEALRAKLAECEKLDDEAAGVLAAASLAPSRREERIIEYGIAR